MHDGLSLKGPGGPLLKHSGRFLVERLVHTSIALHSKVAHWTVQTFLSGLSLSVALNRPWDYQRAASFHTLLCFPVLSLLHQPASFLFAQSDKCMLPSKAEGKEKVETQSPSCILPRNATDLAFRLFAPLIRMPLRNLCRISVHSFSLMKHQISFTNNSRVISTHSRPSQHGCKSGKCSASVRSGSPRTAHHCGTQVKVLTLSGSSDWERQKELVVFKETQYCVSSI